MGHIFSYATVVSSYKNATIKNGQDLWTFLQDDWFFYYIKSTYKRMLGMHIKMLIIIIPPKPSQLEDPRAATGNILAP